MKSVRVRAQHRVTWLFGLGLLSLLLAWLVVRAEPSRLAPQAGRRPATLSWDEPFVHHYR